MLTSCKPTAIIKYRIYSFSTNISQMHHGRFRMKITDCPIPMESKEKIKSNFKKLFQIMIVIILFVAWAIVSNETNIFLGLQRWLHPAIDTLYNTVLPRKKQRKFTQTIVTSQSHYITEAKGEKLCNRLICVYSIIYALNKMIMHWCKTHRRHCLSKQQRPIWLKGPTLCSINKKKPIKLNTY